MAKGSPIKYSDAEMKWIKEHSKLPHRQAHEQFAEKFNRRDVSLANLKSLCWREGWKTGRTGRYDKGQTPLNKGKKMPFNANRAATRFQKGQIPPNQLPLWSERICPKDGYVLMKVPRQNPHTGHSTRFMHKHKYLWEEQNGPVPDSHALKCLNGDKTNCDVSNWELVDRGILPRLNSKFGRNYEAAPAELKPLIMATAKLAHKANSTRKKSDVQQ